MAVYFDLNMYSPTKRTHSFDVESVYQSLTLLLNTRPGEILFNPEFGVPLEDYLFEFADDATALQVFEAVITAVERFEPRVKLDDSRTDVVPYPDDNKFELQLYFTIPSLSEETFEFTGTLSPKGE